MPTRPGLNQLRCSNLRRATDARHRRRARQPLVRRCGRVGPVTCSMVSCMTPSLRGRVGRYLDAELDVVLGIAAGPQPLPVLGELLEDDVPPDGLADEARSLGGRQGLRAGDRVSVMLFLRSCRRLCQKQTSVSLERRPVRLPGTRSRSRESVRANSSGDNPHNSDDRCSA